MNNNLDDKLRRLLSLGTEYYRMGDFDRAEEALIEFSESHESYADVFNMLGVIHHSRGRLDQAEVCLESALSLNPHYTEAALNLSVTYNDQGKYDEAKVVYEKAMATSQADRGDNNGNLDPYARGKIANLHADLAAAYASASLLADAVRELERALYICPGFVDVRTRLGDVLRDMGRPKAAIEQYEIVLKQKPQYLDAQIALGVTLFSLGRVEDARDSWKKALSSTPGDQRAKAYLRMLDSPRAPKTS